MTAMKTVSARIRGAKSELEELGEEYEDVAEGFSKYRDELKALTNVDGSGGIDIMLDETTNSYKDIYEIFVEISGVWDKLSDTTQARVAEILGGTRQLSVISSLITNIKDAEGAYEDAMHSAGVAAEANNIVMDTTEKKVEQLKTSFQVLSRDVLSSDLTKGIVDFGTKSVEVIDNLVNKFGALPVALTAIGGFDIIKNLGKIYCPPRERFLAA